MNILNRILLAAQAQSGLLSRGDFLASRNRVIKHSCWRGFLLVWGRESKALFEDSGTDWHLCPALEGSLDPKLNPFLASCCLGSCHLPPSCSQCPGPPGPSVLQHMWVDSFSSSSSKRRRVRSFLFHAELDPMGREGLRRCWLPFSEFMVSVCWGYLHCKQN